MEDNSPLVAHSPSWPECLDQWSEPCNPGHQSPQTDNCNTHKGETNPKHRVSAFRIIFVWEAAYLACRKSSLLKGLCLWPHLFRRPQQEWLPSPTPLLPPRGSKVKFSRWFRLIFFGPANWAGLNSARRVSATWRHGDRSHLTKCMSTSNCWSFLTTKWGQ